MARHFLRRCQSAFSLIEIVLAVGIIAFALVGILGLFPVALNSARDSQNETQAALIARSIYNDLASLPADETMIVISTNLFSEEGSPALSDENRISVNLATEDAYYVKFTEDGAPDGRIQASAFESGVEDAGFLGEIRISTNLPTNLPPDVTGLSRVEILISAPATAPKERRRSYPFVTLMPNQPMVNSSETP